MPSISLSLVRNIEYDILAVHLHYLVLQIRDLRIPFQFRDQIILLPEMHGEDQITDLMAEEVLDSTTCPVSQSGIQRDKGQIDMPALQSTQFSLIVSARNLTEEFPFIPPVPPGEIPRMEDAKSFYFHDEGHALLITT